MVVKMDKELNAQQELFLEYLFHDAECMGSTMLACEKAGYERTYHHTLVKSLSEEIVSRSTQYLALHTPRAVCKLVGAMDEDKSVPGADIRLKAVESLLDRVGVSKRQQIEMSSSDDKPIFFIPAKAELHIPEE
jgi:hypothetical protein